MKPRNGPSPSSALAVLLPLSPVSDTGAVHAAAAVSPGSPVSRSRVRGAATLTTTWRDVASCAATPSSTQTPWAALLTKRTRSGTTTPGSVGATRTACENMNRSSAAMQEKTLRPSRALHRSPKTVGSRPVADSSVPVPSTTRTVAAWDADSGVGCGAEEGGAGWGAGSDEGGTIGGAGSDEGAAPLLTRGRSSWGV